MRVNLGFLTGSLGRMTANKIDWLVVYSSQFENTYAPKLPQYKSWNGAINILIKSIGKKALEQSKAGEDTPQNRVHFGINY